MKKSKNLFATISTTTLLLIMAGCGSDEASSDNPSADSNDVQEITITLAHEVAENTSQHVGSLAVKDYIEEASDGKIEVQVYPNGQLFGDQDVYQQLVANNVQITQIDLSKLVGDDPRFNIVSLPFLFDGDEEAARFWDSEEGMEILTSLDKDGIYGISMWPNGPKHLTNDVRPLETPADLQGLTFRTQGGQVLEEVFSAVGAGSTSIPFTELYTSLQQGTVDGQTNTFVNIESKKFDEVQQYLTIIGDTRVDLGLFVNQGFMDGLNDATRQIVEDGLQAGTDVARSAAIDMNNEALETLKERGIMEIHELSPEALQEFTDAWESVYEKYTPIIGEEYIEAARAANE